MRGRAGAVLQVPQEKSGCVIYELDPLAPAAKVLQQKDVVLSIEGTPIADDCTVQVCKALLLSLLPCCLCCSRRSLPAKKTSFSAKLPRSDQVGIWPAPQILAAAASSIRSTHYVGHWRGLR